jgi:NAD(P)-dependent dehydrogenase (short-subunit alcohol dehydrogenase family)
VRVRSLDPELLDNDLRDRRIIVTGGGRGIGRAVSLALARHGADVAITYRRDVSAADTTVAEIREQHRNAVAVQVDLRQTDGLHEVLDVMSSTIGPINGVVFAAGIISRGGPIENTPLDEFQSLLGVHLLGPLVFCQILLPELKRMSRSDIIFITSAVTRAPRPGTAPYAVAKAATGALMSVLAREGRDSGVRVNAIAPTLVDTDMGRRVLRSRGQDAETYARLAPFGEIIEPAEIGEICAFMLSKAARHISGHTLYVDAATP